MYLQMKEKTVVALIVTSNNKIKLTKILALVLNLGKIESSENEELKMPDAKL